MSVRKRKPNAEAAPPRFPQMDARSELAENLIVALCSWIGQRGLTLQRRTDFEGWVATMKAAPSITAVSPAFDPDYCDLGQAFWLLLRDEKGWPVGTITAKLLNGEMLDLVASGKLWFGHRADSSHVLRLRAAHDLPDLSGRMAYFGGLWLHPDLRSRGLSTTMPRLIRALSMLHWRPDLHFGGVLGPLAERNLPIKAYGYAQMVQVTEKQHFPVTGREDSWHVPWETPAQWERSTRQFLTEILTLPTEAAQAAGDQKSKAVGPS